MDPTMQPEQSEGPEADDVIIALLQQLVEQGKSNRAESVMAPPPPEAGAPPPPGEGDDQDMADLEAMLGEAPPEGADVGTGGPPDAGEPCPKCGKSPCEC